LTRADWDALAAYLKKQLLALPGASAGVDPQTGAQTITFNSLTVGQTVTVTVLQAVYGEAQKSLG